MGCNVNICKPRSTYWLQLTTGYNLQEPEARFLKLTKCERYECCNVLN